MNSHSCMAFWPMQCSKPLNTMQALQSECFVNFWKTFICFSALLFKMSTYACKVQSLSKIYGDVSME